MGLGGFLPPRCSGRPLLPTATMSQTTSVFSVLSRPPLPTGEAASHCPQAFPFAHPILSSSILPRGFPRGQLVKNPPAMQETWVQSLGWEDPLEKGKATHSSILAWRIPWTSPWGCKESDTTERLSFSHTPARNVGQGSLFHFAVRKVSFRKRKEGSAQEKLEDLEVRKDLQIQKAWDMEVGLAQSAFPQRAELCRRHMQGTTKCRALWASEPRSFICQLADAGETLTSLSISFRSRTRGD